MASITLNIPDAIAARTLNAFCEHHGYQSQILVQKSGGAVFVPNPETKIAFLKRKLIEYVKYPVKEKDAKLAADTARVVTEQEIDLT